MMSRDRGAAPRPIAHSANGPAYNSPHRPTHRRAMGRTETAAHPSTTDEYSPYQPCARNKRQTPDCSRHRSSCLLYTSDAADDLPRVDLGGRRIIKKTTKMR